MESIAQKIERAYNEMGKPSTVDATIRSTFINGSDQVRLLLTLNNKKNNNSTHIVELGVMDFYATGQNESLAKTSIARLVGDGATVKTVSAARKQETKEIDVQAKKTTEVAA